MKAVALVALWVLPCFAQDHAQFNTVADSKTIATATFIEPLLDVTSFPVATGYSITLEPGIRATKSEQGYLLSTHDGLKLGIAVGDKTLNFTSPIEAKLVGGTWALGNGSEYSGSTLRASRVQDDTDNNLKSMQESAKKLKSKSNPNNQQGNNPGKKKGNLRFLFGSSNPMGSSEAFSSTAIQQLSHTSAIGF